MTPTPPSAGDANSGHSWKQAASDEDRAPAAPTAASAGGRSSSSRRLLQLAGVLATLLVAALAFAWTEGGNEGSFNPIAQAAIRTEESPGARISFHGTVRKDSQTHSVTMSGEGAFNGQTRRSRITMTIDTRTGDVKMQTVGSGTQLYLKSKLLRRGLPEGDDWLGFDAALGSDSEIPVSANSDPGAQLDLLRAASDEFERIGKKKVADIETTGYRSTFDPDSYAQYLRNEGSEKAAQQYERIGEVSRSRIEAVTWIDAKGLVRQLRMTGHSQDPSSKDTTTTDITANYYDFGISPDIQLPDPNTIYDVTPIIRQKLGLGSPG